MWVTVGLEAMYLDRHWSIEGCSDRECFWESDFLKGMTEAQGFGWPAFCY